MKKHYKFNLIFFSLLFTIAGWLNGLAQQNTYQSQLDPNSKLSKEERFRILSRLTLENWKISPTTSIIYGKEALALANELDDDLLKAEIYNNLGVANYYNNSFSIALDYFFNALEIRKEIGDEKPLANILNNIGNVYLAIGNQDKAIEYYQSSLEIKERTNQQKHIPSTLINIASLYNSKGEQEKAFIYINRAIVLLENEADSTGLSSAWNNLAGIYDNMGKIDKSIEFNKKALLISKRQNSLWEMSYISNKLGENYLELKNLDSANKYLELGLNIAQKVSTKDVLMLSFKNQALYNSAICNHQKFKNAFDRFNNIKDSIFSEQNSRALAEMQVIYETEQKEKQNAIQKLQIEKERSLRNSFIFISVIVIILIIIIYYRYSVKKKINIELEQKVQMRTIDLINSHEKISKLNEELIKNQAKLKEAQRIGKIGNWDWDYKNKKFSYSKEVAAIFSSPGEELSISYETFIEKIHPADKHWITKIAKGEFNGSSFLSFDLRLVEGSKITKYLTLQGEIEFNELNQPVYIQGTIQDITERKNLELALLSNTIETEERERRRFSEDLHDGLGPLLSTVKIHLELIEGRNDRIEDQKKIIHMASNLIDEAISSTREIANNLTPNILNDFGLFEAIMSYVHNLNELGSIKIDLVIPDTHSRLPKPIELALYRISLELVNNTLKHAKASKINIIFSINNNMLQLNYSDNGIGFNYKKTTGDNKLGLSNIFSRIKSVDGEYSINSNEGEGFQIKIWVKLK